MWYWAEEALHLQVKWRWQFVPDEWRKAGQLRTFGFVFVLLLKNVKIKRGENSHKVNDQFSVIPPAIAVPSALYCCVLSKQKQAKSSDRWTCVIIIPLSFCVIGAWSRNWWGPDAIMTACQYMCTNADKQWDGYTKHLQWSPKVNVKKKYLRRPWPGILKYQLK